MFLSFFFSLSFVIGSSEINRFKHLRLRCSRFYNHLNFLLRCKLSRVILKSTSYKLARFLSQSLAHLTCNNLYTVKHSYDFVDKLKFISPSNYTKLSLDVKSLFTNVPVQEALDCLEKRLREFHYSSVKIYEILNLVHCVLAKQPLFSMLILFPQILKALE